MKRSFEIFSLMLWRDTKTFLRNYHDQVINSMIWVLSIVGVATYLLPLFGLTRVFGVFILASTVGSIGVMQAMLYAMTFVADLEGDNQISYDLTLPLKSSWVFIERAVAVAIRTFLLSILVLPVGKLFFWNRIELTNFCWWKFLLIIIVQSIFYGFLSNWYVSFIPEFEKAEDIWLRLNFPLWFLGGYQFTWASVYSLSPYLAYLALINPVFYVMEGMRSAVIGSDGSLNFWLCVGALLVFSGLLAWRGTFLLKRRLDSI